MFVHCKENKKAYTNKQNTNTWIIKTHNKSSQLSYVNNRFHLAANDVFDLIELDFNYTTIQITYT